MDTPAPKQECRKRKGAEESTDSEVSLQSGTELKTRKKVVEKMAAEILKLSLELYKATGLNERSKQVRIFRNRVIFGGTTSCNLDAPSCNWSQLRPCYCSSAILRFETYLPDREYLTRFSVFCPRCADKESVFHLYCSFCDEVLTGTKAEPGGKIADHLGTIRHIVKEANILQNYLKKWAGTCTELSIRVENYLAKLEEWANTVRFKKQSAEKAELQEVLLNLKSLRTCSPVTLQLHSASDTGQSTQQAAHNLKQERQEVMLMEQQMKIWAAKIVQQEIDIAQREEALRRREAILAPHMVINEDGRTQNLLSSLSPEGPAHVDGPINSLCTVGVQGGNSPGIGEEEGPRHALANPGVTGGLLQTVGEDSVTVDKRMHVNNLVILERSAA